MSKEYKNEKKERFLQAKKQLSSFFDEHDDLIKFSFKFFSFGEDGGESFEEWQKEAILADLNNKLKDFSAKKKIELINEKTLEIYECYPKGSKFKEPKSLEGVNVRWARFDITGKRRLIGFFEESDRANSNVFYVVFLDKNHQFAPSKKKNT